MATRFEPGRVKVYRRKKLPHWNAEHGVQFVTFKTADLHFDAATASLVVDTLLHDDEREYELIAWCVMPNHVHVILRPKRTIAELVKTWKSVSARKINARLGRSGAVWQTDYFDRLMRDDDELRQTIEYVMNNPIDSDWPHVRSYPERIAKLI